MNSFVGFWTRRENLRSNCNHRPVFKSLFRNDKSKPRLLLWFQNRSRAFTAKSSSICCFSLFSRYKAALELCRLSFKFCFANSVRSHISLHFTWHSFRWFRDTVFAFFSLQHLLIKGEKWSQHRGLRMVRSSPTTIRFSPLIGQCCSKIYFAEPIPSFKFLSCTILKAPSVLISLLKSVKQ